MGVSTVASYTGARSSRRCGASGRRRSSTATSPAPRDSAASGSTRSRRRSGTPRPTRWTDCPPRTAVSRSQWVQWREGEPHLFDREVRVRPHATRTGRYDVLKQYTQRVDEQSSPHAARALPLAKDAEALGRQPVPIEEVEPVSELVKRFSTAPCPTLEHKEAHETLAIAMNRLGGKSNTTRRRGLRPAARPGAPQRHQAGGLRPVRRDREILTNSDDIQIKMAQGAKPGEGGQLPGHKVYPWVAKPGTARRGRGPDLPAAQHHDIYSIEDLAQLIPRPQERQPVGARARQARRRGRGRDRGRGCSKRVVLI